MPVLHCVGPASVNQAVKAIAIARKYVQADGIDLCFQVRKKAEGEIKELFTLNLFKVELDNNDPIEYSVMKSASSSAKNSLAGAIAGKLRSGETPKVCCVGVLSVFKAVLALATATRFLEDDKISMQLFPEFAVIDLGRENGTSSMEIKVLVIP